MQYQLILQFRGDSIDAYDAMIALEDDLVTALGDSADVDGHDVGSNETNIFIITSNPADAFAIVRPVLQRAGHLNTLTAAYREIDGERYVKIWPDQSPGPFRVT